MKQELLKDVAGTISFTPWVNNRPAIASSATVTVEQPTGADIVTAQSATVDATTGEIKYNLSAAQTATLDSNYVARWTYVIATVTYYQTTLFDIVRYKLAITVTDDHLKQEQSDILDRNESTNGAVDSSGNTTLVDADLKKYADDYWNGGTITAMLPSSGAEQTRMITNFVSSTGTITIDNTWGTNPTSSYTYIIRKGFKDIIQRAFDEIVYEVTSKGFRPALIIEPSMLHIPHVKKALAMICLDYMKEADDKWDTLSLKYEKQYRDFMDKLVLDYDYNDTGYIESKEENKSMGSLRMRR